MMPINNNAATASSVPLCHLVEANDDALLLTARQEWAARALPGAGEYRDAAVERLKTMLANGAAELDLSDLRLTALPQVFPCHLKALNISYNRLTTLPETLPDSLEELDVDQNKLVRLPVSLPASLIKLTAEYNKLTALSCTLPDSLILLSVVGNELESLPERLPMYLKLLFVRGNKLTRLPETLPTPLRVLCVDDNPLDSFYQAREADFLAKLTGWNIQVKDNDWKAICREIHASDFATFLDKLREESSSKERSALQDKVKKLLDILLLDDFDSVRQFTFQKANNALKNRDEDNQSYFDCMYHFAVDCYENFQIREKIVVINSFI